VSSADPAALGRLRQRGGVLVFLGSGVGVALMNGGFQRIVARRVGTDDLGALNALLAIVGGVGLLGLGLQVALARAGLPRIRLARAAVIAGSALAVATALVVPGPAWYRVAVGAALGVAMAGVLVGVAPRAKLLATASWRRLACAYVAGGATRLAALPAVFASVDNRLLGAMLATAFGECVTSVAARWLARPRWRDATLASARDGIDATAGRALLRASAALIGVWTLTVADTIIARLRLAEDDADGYAFASTVARSSFFLAILLAHLALPTFMAERGRSAGLRRAFVATISAISIGVGIVGVVLVVAPQWCARQFLDQTSTSIDPATLRLLSVAWVLMSLVPLLTYFHLDRHPRLALVPLASAAVIIGAGMAVSTPRALAAVVTVVLILCVTIIGVPASQRLVPVTRSVVWEPSNRVPHETGDDVTIVVPFFNPGSALVDTVDRLVRALDASGVRHRVVAVSDGSTDGSAELLKSAALSNVEVVVTPTNRGKGAALRVGLARSTGSFVGYLDADGDLPPEQMIGMIDIAAATGADAVVGSKLHPASDVDVEGYRRAMSTVFRTLVRVMFRLDVRDTQTGIKLYRGDLLAGVLPLLREDGFAIDVEILVAAMRSRPIAIVEAPVRIARVAMTTVSWRRSVATVAALVRISWRDHVALAYEPVPATVVPATT
jgi:hypothetical protein